MNPTSHLHRRTFLRGLGTAIALPLLESMTPLRAAAASVAASKAPVRMAFLFVPNGVHLPAWTPKEEGAAVTYERNGIVERCAMIVPDTTGYRLVDEVGITFAEAAYDANGAVTWLNRDRLFRAVVLSWTRLRPSSR